MTWTRISDDFTDRPEILELTDAAFRLDITATVYCNRILSDGRLPKRVLPRLWAGDTTHLVSELILAGRWSDAGEAFQLDWTEQEPAETIKRRRERNAAHQATYRERRDRHMSGDHSICTKACPQKVSKPLTEPVSNVAPSPPVPSRGKGEGQDHTPPAGGRAACGHEMVDDRHCTHGCPVLEEAVA